MSKLIKFRQPIFGHSEEVKFEGFHYWGFVGEVTDCNQFGTFVNPIVSNWEHIDRPFPNMNVAQYPEKSQQTTGQFDKNRKEIYEGDIVQGGNYDDGEPRLKVIQSYETNYNSGWDFGTLPRLDQFCEVRGNIYENPELIP